MSKTFSYTTRILFLLSFFTQQVSVAQTLNGTGTTGAPGRDGVSYPRGERGNRGTVVSRGQCETTRGRSGGDGTNAAPGSRGADYNLNISDVGQILVTGSMTTYEVGRQRVEDIYKNAQITSVLQISSRGGQGGRPGQGGDGEGAQEGQDSRDNARHENEDGGDGCDAGLAGSGGDSGTPGNGGDGGNIKIRLSSEDTHLLLALSTDVRGGRPGDMLSGGRPGERASGGKGAEGFYEDRSGEYPTGRMVDEAGCTPRRAGNYGTGRYENEAGCTPTSGGYEDGPCEWKSTVTSDTESVECVPTRVYVPGNSCRQVEVTEYLSEIRCRQVPEMVYRRVIVQTADGRAGADSPSANPGASSPATAVAGNNGSTVFEVVDSSSGRVNRYSTSDLMNLEMLGYDMVDEDRNGIFEPGEKVTLTNLRIRNRGAMDYKFTKAQTLVFLKTSSWMIADPQQLEIPQVKAGETITIGQPGLTFTVRSNTFKANSTAPVWEDTIVPYNRITRIEKQWDRLALSKSFYITFPVKLTAFTLPENIEAGQSVPISWSVQNLSSADIPVLGQYARSVLTELDFQSSNMTSDLVSLQLGGERRNLGQGVVQMISGLKANETRVVEGVLTVSANAEPYSTASLGLGLKINGFNSDEMIAIQSLQNDIRVTRVYRSRSTDDVLLVLTESNRDIYRAWTSLFQTLGLQGNIWDLSIDGGFSFFNSLSGGGSLSRDFKGKSVVLPKIFDHGSVNGLLTRAHGELFSAAAENNNSLYMIGYETKDFQALLQNSLSTSQTVQHLDKDSFFAKAKKGYVFTDGERHEIKVQESYFFVRIPRMDSMIEIKNEIDAYLRTNFPGQFFMTSIVFDPKQTGSGLRATYDLGRILVRKGVDFSKSKLVLLPTQSSQNRANFIASTDNVRSMCLSLNATTKVKVLKTILSKKQTSDLYLRTILSCIQHDIYQDWIKTADMKKTLKYLEVIRGLYPSATTGAQNSFHEFIGMLLTMGEDGGFAPAVSQQVTQSALVKNLSSTAMTSVNQVKERIKTRVSGAIRRTGTQKALMTKKVILSAVNPRAQTSGVDANDLTQ
jgi:hypothetical protein